MDGILVGSLVLIGVAAAAVGLIELEAYRARQRGARTVELRFGRDVTSEAVVATLGSIAGLHRGTCVVLDVEADSRGIRHFLTTDGGALDTLRGSLRAVLPALRLTAASPRASDAQYRSGRALRLRGRLKLLRVDGHEQANAGLLAALQPLGRDERVLLRWVIRPGAVRALAPQPENDTVPSDSRRLLRTKHESAGLAVRGFLAASTGHPARAAHLLARPASVLRSRSTANGHLRLTPRPRSALRRDLGRRYFASTDRYSPGELAGLLAWPLDAPALPGVSLGTSPLLIPSDRLPRSGRMLGTTTWPGSSRPVAQPVVGGLSHTLIAGPTGVGKSTLVTNLAAADIEAGRPVVLIDGKGDTAEALLARVPETRHGDVLVLDCASPGPLPGLKLFGSDQPELAADVVLGVLSDLFKESWGPLSERYLRAGLSAVAHDPDGTLADVPFVYSDATYRRRLVGQLRDPIVRSTLLAFESMGAGERQQQLAAPLNKLGTLLGRPVVRTVLGQTAPKVDFRAVLAGRKVAVISLAPARVGAAAARLIGALTVFALFQAVQSRSALSESARRPAFIYIDEPRALGDLPIPLDALLEQARGLGVGVCLSPQSLTQLPKSVREAALTNIATRLVFRQHADDARLLARDLPGVTPEDLGDLAAYEAVARVGLGPGDVAPPVTIRTHRASKRLADSHALRALSAARYGQTLEDVDAQLAKRHQALAPPVIGRTRRTP